MANTNLTLDSLLSQINSSMEKSAEEAEDKKDEKDEKAEGKKELPAWLKDKVDAKDEKKDEKKEDKEDKDEGSEKKASLSAREQGAALFEEIMSKVAEQNKDETSMNKQAQVAGQALGQALLASLQKQANAGDITIMDGTAADGTVPNKVHADAAQQVAEADANVKPMLTGDGVRNHGTVNEIYDAIIQDALAQGAAGDEQVHAPGVVDKEGNAESAVPNQIKVAALNSLLEAGVDFADAVDFIKSAEKSPSTAGEIFTGYFSPGLMRSNIKKKHTGKGSTFGEGLKDHVVGTGRAVGRYMAQGAAGGAAGAGVGAGVAKLMGKKVPAGAVIGGLVGGYGAGYHGMHRSIVNQADEAHKEFSKKASEANQGTEKMAAVSALVAEGLDFEDAVELVKQAEAEIAFEMEKTAAVAELMDEGISFDEAVELVKEASAGDVTVTDGSAAAGTVPNKVQTDDAQQVAEADATVKPMLTGDGVRNHGTVNEIYDAIVQDALAQGATGEEQVHQQGVSGMEGNAESAVPSQVKVAAIKDLMAAGVDFEDAVEFVKSASVGQAVRGAASRMAAPFRRAAGAVKSTDAYQNATTFAEHVVKPHAQNAAKLAKGVVSPEGLVGKKLAGKHPVLSRLAAAKELAKNPVAQGAAALGAVGAGAAGYALTREKKAAFDALVDGGVDFTTAAQLVEAKAAEIYGE